MSTKQKAAAAREEHPLYPIAYSILNEYSPEAHSFGDVVMLKDFGPLKKGDHIPWIWFNLERATCQVYDEDGVKPSKEFPITMSAGAI